MLRQATPATVSPAFSHEHDRDGLEQNVGVQEY